MYNLVRFAAVEHRHIVIGRWQCDTVKNAGGRWQWNTLFYTTPLMKDFRGYTRVGWAILGWQLQNKQGGRKVGSGEIWPGGIKGRGKWGRTK